MQNQIKNVFVFDNMVFCVKLVVIKPKGLKMSKEILLDISELPSWVVDIYGMPNYLTGNFSKKTR